MLTLGSVWASTVRAQSWSEARPNPTLWQIISVDRSGEPSWPYGREDVAGDGFDAFTEAEASSDLRSVYADSDANRLWLRAYVSSSNEPPAALRAFFFFDSDGRNGTGGPARGGQLDNALEGDSTGGGYELAVSVRGDGDELRVWQWDTSLRAWQENMDVRPAELRVERGRARDPLLLGAPNHGYLQLELVHSLSGLTQSCGGNLFVRFSHEGSPAFVDDAPTELSCVAAEDAYGTPVVLRQDGCNSNAECPAGGVCKEGACLFAYECSDADDCPSGYLCTRNRCVRVVSGACDEAADCEGLVCENARCVACSETGAGACARGLLCAPDGSCVDPDDVASGSSANQGEGKVRGGAFSCAVRSERASPLWWALPLLVLPLRRRRRQGRSGPARRRNASSARIP